MSFRKYGGLNYAKSNNIVRNHLSNIDILEISDHIGASGSRITCNSELIVTDDVACTNLTVAYDITGTNAIITEDTTLNMVQGFEDNPITFNSGLLLEDDLVFAPKTSSEPYVKIVFSDGTSQDRLMLTTDTYWQPLPAGNTGSLPDAIFFTKRVVAGADPTSVNDQMAAQNVNFAVNGNAGVLGGFYVGDSGAGPTFINNFSVKPNGDVVIKGALDVSRGATFESNAYIKGTLGVTGGVTLYNTLSVARGTTFESDAYIKGALGVTGGVTLYNTLSVARGTTFESDAYIKGALGVTGGVTLYNTLSVARGVTFSDKLSVTGGVTLYNTLHVAQGATFNDTLSVTGGVTMNNKLYVAQGVTFNDTLSVTGGVTMNNKLYVTQGATFNDTLSVTGGVTLNNKLYVTQGATFNNVLHVAQGVTLNNTLSVTGGVTLYNKLYVSQGATFNDALHVAKGVTLNSTLYVTGGATFASNISVPTNISYMVGSQPLINSLTTVYRAKGVTLDSSHSFLRGFKKNSQSVSNEDSTFDANTGRFTFNKSGVYKVSMDFKPYYCNGGSSTDDDPMRISTTGLDQNNMYMLTTVGGYYENNLWRGFPSYNNNYLIPTSGNYDPTLPAQIYYTIYVTDSQTILNHLGISMSFFIDISDSDISGGSKNKLTFNLTGWQSNLYYLYHSWVIIEKMSSSATYT